MIIKQIIADRQVTLYPSDDSDAPVIYINDYNESGEELLQLCNDQGVLKFHLVTVSDLDWNNDLSPWPCGPVVMKDQEFGGRAEDYMKIFGSEIMPYAEGELGIVPSRRILAGYSMAGLFALYAGFISDRFDDLICVSGSVWFPGFRDFFIDNEFRKEPRKIYFSLGDKESKTRNPVLQTTDAVMRELSDDCTGRGIKSVFELNPGNHFKDYALRMAKGIEWIMGS